MIGFWIKRAMAAIDVALARLLPSDLRLLPSDLRLLLIDRIEVLGASGA